MILSGEFHYWRVPDKERWPALLRQYRAAGLNTIRIYFHWGYHSPDENVYLFDGNRDVDYLLKLCEEIGLYVLAAPGPYICAETQAGGYPSWLIAKRHLNIRHNRMMLWRTYDPLFAAYEVQWLHNLLPIIAKHQITEGGCVLSVQIDNELFETLKILPVGLRDQMRVLAKATRDAGTNVPLFTNDGFEEGGWVPNAGHPWGGSSTRFGIDLYGFDKYVVFAPSSSPKSWLVDGNYSLSEWGEWNPKTIENSMDGLEKTVRGFGGGAKESPLFIPELQGGWFNHYQLSHTYDHIHDYYGDQYTKLIVESSLAQGITMVNVYMFYGGTNWGALGDPDVYTSYDYSACIREFGMMSSRGRSLRETLLFAHSFSPYFTQTERAMKPSIETSIPHTLNTQRVAVNADQAVEFNFFRNFDRKHRSTFQVSMQYPHSFSLDIHLPYKTSFIGLSNYTADNGLVLLLSTLPIYLRMVDAQTHQEVWILQPNAVGALAFQHQEMEVTGTMHVEAVHQQGPISIIKFNKKSGYTLLETAKGKLHIIGLDAQDISTLYADYTLQGKIGLVAWGADTFFHDTMSHTLNIHYQRSQSKIHLLSFMPPKDSRMKQALDSLLYTTSFDDHLHERFPLPVNIPISAWKARSVDWDSFAWEPLQTRHGKPVWDSLDYLYTSGHVLYKTHFNTPSDARASLRLNVRHRATVLVNGQIIGGHTTYSHQLFSAGAKIGPDPWFLGKKTYDISPYLNRQGHLENEVIVVVDSFGLSRQAFIMNDVRNPRGVIHASVQGSQMKPTEEWKIAGVDVRRLEQPYNTTGFPDEHSHENDDKSSSPWQSIHVYEEEGYSFKVEKKGVQWIQCVFNDGLKSASDTMKVPLRLHLEGAMTANVYLNGLLIARYYGNGDGPQHDFYLPDELVQKKSNVLKMLVYTWEETVAKVVVAGWPVDPVSGNLDTEKAEYMVWKDTLSI
ncbi:glycoside hydrolase superfamily [Spinellus fusiger]|nr:glycoside hydrolase superfamily [Spinellus fusiger]